jgi:tetratricopeptide (TPR) repeat protein
MLPLHLPCLGSQAFQACWSSPGRRALGSVSSGSVSSGSVSSGSVSSGSVSSGSGNWRGSLRWVLACLLGVCAWPALGVRSAQAADIADAWAAYYSGDYDKCIELTRMEVERGIWNDGWSKLLIRALLVKGEYAQAVEVYEAVRGRFSASIALRLLGVEALRFAGQDAEARALLDQIPELLRSAPWRYSDRDNMVALGQYFLATGEDAREVLDLFYDRALKSDPRYVDAHIATAELALGKNDYQEAVKSLNKAVQMRPEDPHIHYLLARAWSPSDNARANAALAAALQLNPRHVDSLLMRSEALLDGEDYAGAGEVLDLVAEIHPRHWRVFALRAVIAHVRGQYREEGMWRSQALATWANNPAVDYEIGRKLSRFYRFDEAVQYQRRALRLDPEYLPARFQLAQDLLRLGKVDEGWSIVDSVTRADKYNVVAANLRTLRQRLEQFVTLEEEGFLVRMDAREARIYGARVLNLLAEARQELCAKYDVELREPVTVEIFPQQSDFAIRTFGLPGGAGFLGVCFGQLITANSPASQGDSPANWESVLWHEFCHVVTLQKTNNRMPRWLSEGISVYEEVQRDPGWGQSLNPVYRRMLLGEDFVPLSRLSSAFLQPKSPMHLQFAYFESSLAVRYLVERHGLESLKRLLVDLGVGLPLEDALARIYGDRERLDSDFQSYVREEAGKLFAVQQIDDSQPPPRATLEELQALFGASNPNYGAGILLARRLVAAQQWEAAVAVLNELDRMWPADAEPGGTLQLLAETQRQLGHSSAEREALERIASLSSDAVPVLLRLLELTTAAGEWERTRAYAEQLLAVQPLIAAGHTALAASATRLGQPALAADALASLLELEPLDPPKLHLELAEARLAAGQLDRAREHVLLALEETPRYRAAQRLLLQIVAARAASNQPEWAELPETEGVPPSPH